jgi:CP family cyanate transporter-like MFS transporter
LLTTIPVLCVGLFALPAALLSDRVGPRAAMTLCLVGIAGLGLARAGAPGVAAVLLLTFGMSMGLGAAQAVVPVAVKEDFPTRPAFATGVYALGINLGSAISSAVAVPIATTTGSWRWTLAVYSLFSFSLVVGWLMLTRHAPRHVRSGVSPPRLPWGSGLAWRLAGIFGLMAVTFYGLNAWLPDAYVEDGWSEGAAGALLAALNIAALVTTLTVPWLADRRGSRRLYLTVLSGSMAIAVLGLVVFPARPVWVVLAGLGIVGSSDGAHAPLDAATGPPTSAPSPR